MILILFNMLIGAVIGALIALVFYIVYFYILVTWSEEANEKDSDCDEDSYL